MVQKNGGTFLTETDDVWIKEKKVPRWTYEHEDQNYYKKCNFSPGFSWFTHLAKSTPHIADSLLKNCSVNIPDTFIATTTGERMWLTCRQKGPGFKMIREVNDKEAFMKLALSWGDQEKSDKDRIVAIKKAPKRSDQNKNSASSLNSNEFQALFSSMDDDTMVQRFIPSKNGNAALCRVVWTADNPSKNNGYYLSSDELIVSSDQKDYRVFQLKCIPREVTAMVAQIARMTAVFSQIRMEQVVVDLIRDPDGVWWFVQVKAFTVYKDFDLKKVIKPESDMLALEDDNSNAVLAVDPKKKKRGKVWGRCPVCSCDYPTLELSRKMTQKMMLQLEHHLLKRNINLFHVRRVAMDKLTQRFSVCELCWKLYSAERELVKVEKAISEVVCVQPKKKVANLAGLLDQIPFPGRAIPRDDPQCRQPRDELRLFDPSVNPDRSNIFGEVLAEEPKETSSCGSDVGCTRPTSPAGDKMIMNRSETALALCPVPDKGRLNPIERPNGRQLAKSPTAPNALPPKLPGRSLDMISKQPGQIEKKPPRYLGPFRSKSGAALRMPHDLDINIPTQLTQMRFMFYLHEIEHLVEMRGKDMEMELICPFYEKKPKKIVLKSHSIEKMFVHYMFSQNQRPKAFLRNDLIIKIKTEDIEVNGSLDMNNVTEKGTTVTNVLLFNTKDLEIVGQIRISLGFIVDSIINTAYVALTQCYDCYLPIIEYHSCDPLPEQWLICSTHGRAPERFTSVNSEVEVKEQTVAAERGVSLVLSATSPLFVPGRRVMTAATKETEYLKYRHRPESASTMASTMPSAPNSRPMSAIRSRASSRPHSAVSRSSRPRSASSRPRSAVGGSRPLSAVSYNRPPSASSRPHSATLRSHSTSTFRPQVMMSQNSQTIIDDESSGGEELEHIQNQLEILKGQLSKYSIHSQSTPIFQTYRQPVSVVS